MRLTLKGLDADSKWALVYLLQVSMSIALVLTATWMARWQTSRELHRWEMAQARVTGAAVETDLPKAVFILVDYIEELVVFVGIFLSVFWFGCLLASMRNLHRKLDSLAEASQSAEVGQTTR